MSYKPPSDGPNYRAKWAGRTEFAEVAEAVGVPTNCIMAATETDGRVTVLFSRPEDESVVYGQGFRRDGDGVLHAATEPREQPGMLDHIKREVERDLGKKLGKPKSKRRRPKRKRDK
jgi:hypothetical protein